MSSGQASTPSLVLRLRPLGESDLLVDLFTRQMGRLTALAKGARKSQKRFFGLLLSAHCLDVELSAPKKGGDLWWLDGAVLREAHVGLRQDFRRYLASAPVLELLLRGSGYQDPHPPALDLALITLERQGMAKTNQDLGSALVIFLVRLLGEMGYGLHLQGCVHCGKSIEKARTCCLSLKGGMVCGDCPPGRHGVEVPPGLVKGLKAAVEMEAPATRRLSFPPAVLGPALAFLANFWRAQLQHDLPSLGLALGTLRRGARA